MSNLVAASSSKLVDDGKLCGPCQPPDSRRPRLQTATQFAVLCAAETFHVCSKLESWQTDLVTWFTVLTLLALFCSSEVLLSKPQCDRLLVATSDR